MSAGQSRLASLTEAVVNTLIGLLVAMAAQSAIAWAYDIPLTVKQNAILVFWMTVISIGRSYLIRRLWNSEFWRRWRRE